VVVLIVYQDIVCVLPEPRDDRVRHRRHGDPCGMTNKKLTQWLSVDDRPGARR
jgi:hypothetical protein